MSLTWFDVSPGCGKRILIQLIYFQEYELKKLACFNCYSDEITVLLNLIPQHRNEFIEYENRYNFVYFVYIQLYFFTQAVQKVTLKI